MLIVGFAVQEPNTWQRNFGKGVLQPLDHSFPLAYFAQGWKSGESMNKQFDEEGNDITVPIDAQPAFPGASSDAGCTETSSALSDAS